MKPYKIKILYFIISVLLVCLSYSIFLIKKTQTELEILKNRNELIDSYIYEHSKIPSGRQ